MQQNESSMTQKYTCAECQEVFATKSELDAHLKQIHAGVVSWRSEYSCNICNKTFSQKISLNVHCMFKHCAPRRYQCDKCDYEGPRLYHLKRHMQVHSDERQYICSKCGKGLKTAQSYKNHMVLHTNAGRFTCDVCNKSYNQRTLYEDHLRSHREDRSYTCNYCDAAFKTYKHVACHIRAVHLKDKRFICDLCGARHMTGANLKTHQKTHKNISALRFAYHCSACNASFRGFDGLSVHMNVLHNISITQKDADETGQKFVTPHPTRRPVKLEYNHIPDAEEDLDEPEIVEDEEKADDSGTAEENRDMDDNTVRVEGENFEMFINPEDIEYETEENNVT